MTHHKTSTGSIRTMRRTLMGGAIVSSLLIASLAPASAGCLYPQVTVNAQIIDYSTTQSSQLGVNWSGATGSQNSGGQLRWTPAEDFRSNVRYGNFSRERPSPRAEYGGNISPTAEEFRRRPSNANAASRPQLRYQGEFGGRPGEAIKYDTPRFGSLAAPQSEIRYQGEFGGLRIAGGETVRWGQGGEIPRVNRNDYVPNALSQIPFLKDQFGRSDNVRYGNREVIITVTPTFRPTEER